MTTHKAMVTDESLFNALADAYENGARWRDRYGDLEFLGKAAYDYADKNCPPALAQAETQPVPRMENCGTYLAKDNKDQWHYLNHDGNWCGYQGPITTTETQPVAPIGYMREPGFRSLAEGDCTSIYPKPRPHDWYTIPVFASPVPAKREAGLTEAMGLIRWAHDTLIEINEYNYTHDDVCELNAASVEVILGLAPILGETHGKSKEWWAEHTLSTSSTPADGEDRAAPVPHTTGVELPADVIESLLAIGSVEWGTSLYQEDEKHASDLIDTLRITREHFGIEEAETAIHGVYLEGTGTVLAHTGMSPNSPQHARILVGAWNQLVEIAKAKAATTEGSDNG